MRDPKRIDKVLNIIRLVWSECPNSRLIQLILNVLYKAEMIVSADSIYSIEDEALMKAIVEYGLEFVKDETENKLLIESGIMTSLIEEAKKERSKNFKDWKQELNEL